MQRSTWLDQKLIEHESIEIAALDDSIRKLFAEGAVQSVTIGMNGGVRVIYQRRHWTSIGWVRRCSNRRPGSHRDERGT